MRTYLFFFFKWLVLCVFFYLIPLFDYFGCFVFLFFPSLNSYSLLFFSPRAACSFLKMLFLPSFNRNTIYHFSSTSGVFFFINSVSLGAIFGQIIVSLQYDWSGFSSVLMLGDSEGDKWASKWAPHRALGQEQMLGERGGPLNECSCRALGWIAYSNEKSSLGFAHHR